MIQYARNSFHKAVEYLMNSHIDRVAAPAIMDHTVFNLIHGHKFIVPDAGQMTASTRFDRYADVFRLPYPRIALLREITIEGRPIQEICIAVEASLVTGERRLDGPDFFVSSCLRHPTVEGWIPSRPVGVRYLDEIGGLQTFEIDGAVEEERRLIGQDEVGLGAGCINGITELLVMLSLSNVGTKLVNAPAKLNSKRSKSGKLPIYDYHVLTIDGAPTFGTEGESEKTDREIRSHFRRGHIRRLDETRRVWVRASFVHGRANGFVDKDYQVALA